MCRFLESTDDRVALDAWKYLSDRVHGKPAQSMKLDGEGFSAGLVLIHSIPRGTKWSV